MSMISNFIKDDIADSLQEMLLIVDNKGNVVKANALAKKEFDVESQNEIEKTDVKELFPVMFRENVEVEPLLKECIGKPLETLAYRRNKTCFDVQMLVSNVDGHYLISLLNIHSVMELKKEVKNAREKVKSADTVRNEFVANVTHELRTPVNGIMGHVRYIMDLPDVDSDIQNTMKIIETCCQNMSKIINNLLDFSKMEAGKFSIEEKEFSLRDCIKQVVDTNIKRANEKGIELETLIADDIPKVLLGDELRISQILNNLVSNAVKFTSIGKVKLQVIKSVQYGNEIELFIMVMDTGIGIAVEDKDKLFKSFSQVDGSITRKYGGTGLGLSVTKNLVEMMRGNIHVQSSPGKGSTFACSIILHTLEADKVTVDLNETSPVKPDITKLMQTRQNEDEDKVYQFGTSENKKEIQKNMEKLILCMEMESWNNAEKFAMNIKQLLKGAGDDFIRIAFKLEMSVRKESYEKSIEHFHTMCNMLPKDIQINMQ